MFFRSLSLSPHFFWFILGWYVQIVIVAMDIFSGIWTPSCAPNLENTMKLFNLFLCIFCCGFLSAFSLISF